MKPVGTAPPDQSIIFTSCSPTSEPSGRGRAATTTLARDGSVAMSGVACCRMYLQRHAGREAAGEQGEKQEQEGSGASCHR